MPIRKVETFEKVVSKSTNETLGFCIGAQKSITLLSGTSRAQILESSNKQFWIRNTDSNQFFRRIWICDSKFLNENMDL